MTDNNDGIDEKKFSPGDDTDDCIRWWWRIIHGCWYYWLFQYWYYWWCIVDVPDVILLLMMCRYYILLMVTTVFDIVIDDDEVNDDWWYDILYSLVNEMMMLMWAWSTRLSGGIANSPICWPSPKWWHPLNLLSTCRKYWPVFDIPHSPVMTLMMIMVFLDDR